MKPKVGLAFAVFLVVVSSCMGQEPDVVVEGEAEVVASEYSASLENGHAVGRTVTANNDSQYAFNLSCAWGDDIPTELSAALYFGRDVTSDELNAVVRIGEEPVIEATWTTNDYRIWVNPSTETAVIELLSVMAAAGNQRMEIKVTETDANSDRNTYTFIFDDVGAVVDLIFEGGGPIEYCGKEHLFQ